MAALVIANKTLAKMTVSTDFLQVLKAKEYLTEDEITEILVDPEIKDFFAAPKKKTMPDKVQSNAKISDNDRNSSEYDPCKCSARLWKPVDDECNPCSGKYGGLDNVQCRSAMLDGSEFCKKHTAQAEAMGGWWLGKVNEPRPESPMLPKGSLKKGYNLEDLQPHFWKYDSDGNLVEKNSGRRRKNTSKKPVEEPLVEEKQVEENPVEEESLVEEKPVEEEEPLVEEKQVEEKPVEEKSVEGPLVDGEPVEEDDSISAFDDPSGEENTTEDECDLDKDTDHPLVYQGVNYIKHWDEEDDKWIIVDPEEWYKVGEIDGEGSIEFVDDEEQEKHNKKRDE